MRISLCLLTACLLSTAAIAQQDPDNALEAPQFAMAPQQAGSLTYVTGGIGDEEREALAGMKANYNVHVLSAGAKSGEFEGATRLVIHPAAGENLLDVEMAGPYLFTSLPPGAYAIEATNEGKTQKKNITLKAGRSADVNFYW